MSLRADQISHLPDRIFGVEHSPLCLELFVSSPFAWQPQTLTKGLQISARPSTPDGEQYSLGLRILNCAAGNSGRHAVQIALPSVGKWRVGIRWNEQQIDGNADFDAVIETSDFVC
jgi:hypothetical protein